MYSIALGTFRTVEQADTYMRYVFAIALTDTHGQAQVPWIALPSVRFRDAASRRTIAFGFQRGTQDLAYAVEGL